MKIRLLLTLAGLPIGIAFPTLAQEQNAVDPKVRQQIQAVISKFDDAYYKNDSAAIADLFTQDAIQAWDFEGGGTVSGQQAIEKIWAGYIEAGRGEFRSKLLQVYPIGSEVSGFSEWSLGIWKGCWSAIYVRDADTWRSAWNTPFYRRHLDRII